MKILPTDVSSQVYKFISNLDSTQYFQYKAFVANSVRNGGKYPDSLTAVIDLASNFVYINPRVDKNRSNSVYHVKKNKNYHQNHHNNNNIAESKSNTYKNHKIDDKKDDENHENQRQFSSKFKGNCYKCGKYGHKANVCRSKSEHKSNFYISWKDDHEDEDVFPVNPDIETKQIQNFMIKSKTIFSNQIPDDINHEGDGDNFNDVNNTTKIHIDSGAQISTGLSKIKIYINRQVTANILSLSQLSNEGYKIIYNNFTNEFTVCHVCIQQHIFNNVHKNST